MGVNSDPVTLHKYVYGNLDPVNNIDPTGNFSMGQMMSAINVVGILATTAYASYDIYQYSTGEKEFTARNAGWTFLILASGPIAGKALKVASAYRSKRILEGAIKSGGIGKLFVKGGRTSESTLRQFIPGKAKNIFVPNDTIKAGFRYKFDIAGVKMEIKWHSPHLTAPLGSNSRAMWTAQIKIKNKYLGTDGKLYRNNKNNHTHIPIDI